MGRRRQDTQVAVVTGASAGVGRATVRLLARRGIAIALLARGRVGLAAAAEEVGAAGSSSSTGCCPGCPGTPSRYRPSTSRRWPPARSSAPRTGPAPALRR